MAENEDTSGSEDPIDNEAAAQKLKDEPFEGGHVDVEKAPNSVMTEALNKTGSTGDPTTGANADEYADSDVFKDTDDEAHQEAQERAEEIKDDS